MYLEKEINETKAALIKTLKIYRKLKKQKKEIEQMQALPWEDGKILPLWPKFSPKYEIYETASRHLARKANKLLGFGYISGGLYEWDEKPGFKRVVESIKEIKTDLVLKEFNDTIWYKKPFSIKGNTIKIESMEPYLRLTLNTLNILINGDFETDEVYEKAIEALNSANTFIYRNIKITLYKNESMLLVFADDKIKNKFEKLLTQAL